MGWLTNIAVWAGVLAAIITVHELGHYLGAVAGGVRRGDVRLRLLTFPQHVVLRDGTGWVAPFDGPRFHDACVRAFGLGPRYFLFVAGGLLAQTAFVAAACLALSSLGHRWLAWLFASESGILYAVYLVAMDLPLTLRNRWPWGDTTGLWWLSRGGAVAVALGVIVVHAALMAYTFGRL